MREPPSSGNKICYKPIVNRLGHVDTGHGSHESRSMLSLSAAVSQLRSELEHGLTLQTQQLKPEMKTASVQQQKLASSSKAVKLPVGTGFSDQDLHPYDVISRRYKVVMGEILDKHGKTEFDGCKPAYDRRKGFYIAGALPFRSKDFPGSTIPTFIKCHQICSINSNKCLVVSGSCDGLLALYNPKLGIALLNIATRKHQVLPQFWSDFDSFSKFYDGFGDDSDAYKLVRIVSSGESLIEVNVYNLRDNALRKIDVDFPYFLEICHGFGIFVRGVLNWFCFT
ncbi:hypothetical protein Ddye_010207 [Dipteronia dyeriana]|uniref:F-box associated beta-propeller type 1 domain-containing protein n=1 Tax=Dipteronia dyeriana TaxID=168575 RepID=A0AAD9XD25_9ROSI|nr:hypothetical protein Ddye_010207 [Dipteronia dyeriana]